MKFRILCVCAGVLGLASNVPAQGRGGIPNLTAEQTAALAQMNADLTTVMQSLSAARGALVATALTQPRSDAAIRAQAQAIGAAEVAVANARADAFAKVQSSPNKLAPEQIAALAAGRGGGRGGGPGTVGVPNLSPAQGSALAGLNSHLAPLTQKLNAARAAVISTSYAVPRNDADIQAKVEAVVSAEAALANARADWFANIQASPNKLAGNRSRR
jgi:hypothetical protein